MPTGTEQVEGLVPTESGRPDRCVWANTDFVTPPTHSNRGPGGAGRLLQALDRLPQLLPRLFHVLGDHLNVGEDRHEVRIPAPARHDVVMYVVIDAGSAHSAEVYADVEPVRGHRQFEGPKRTLNGVQNLEMFVVGESREGRNMLVGDDHQVTAVVRVAVHDHEAVVPAPEDEILLVLTPARLAPTQLRLRGGESG